MNIQDLKSNTTWQEASNTINNNNNKISLAIATLENAKLKNKGYFTTLEKLNEAVPNPTIGSKAYVGTSEPYAIYIVENGAWVDSGYTGGNELVAKITTDRIEDGAVTTEKIATSAFDPTLSVSGKIAPANIVGGKLSDLEKLDDIINGVESKTEDIKSKLTLNAGYVAPNGEVTTYSVMYFYTSPFKINKGDSVIITTGGTGVAFISVTDSPSVSIGDTLIPKAGKSYVAEEDTYVVFSGQTELLQSVILTISHRKGIKEIVDDNSESIGKIKGDLYSTEITEGKAERITTFQTLFENIAVDKNNPYRVNLNAEGGNGQVKLMFYYNDGLSPSYDDIFDIESFVDYDGLFFPSRATSTGSLKIYTPTSANWQRFTYAFCKYGKHSVIDGLKNSSVREVVNVKSTDTEVQIFNKMLLAFSIGNCDVVFECATYVFSEIYIYMRDNLGWKWTMGLPIGNGCRYFFNGSTLISNAPTGAYTDSRNLLDCKAIGTDYELHDATLINNGGTYCVHDEGASDQRSYMHLYHNIIFNNDGATSCFGCGLGYHSVIKFDGCVFLSSIAGSVHGPNPNNGVVDFTIVVKDTYFADYTFGLSSLLDKTRDNLKIIFCNNSYKRLNAVDFNVMMFYNNEVRTSSSS